MAGIGSYSQTANPAWSNKAFRPGDFTSKRMTLQGTINRTFLLTMALLIAAAFTWNQSFNGNQSLVTGLLVFGLIAGFILALITIFIPKAAPFTSIPYALAEGLVLGGISARYESLYDGVTMQAALLTFGVLLLMLLFYKTGLIKVTKKFRIGVLCATGAIMLAYLITFIMRLFGVHDIFYMHSSGPIGILISVGIVIVAALNLALDFDLIERGVKRNAPKHMEWYGAFGLMVTLVWLYLEILRLISKLRR
ncbi:Bax inhibitor-1/YccA family protein [Virgibacillus siamensis]|uniref:Bax inhibitor-1/YccA family protein n=1 Tax=Virgibacillus siamensis TaxID=480071 RepID=UPI00098759F6|nr:Bax inhibitor-1/YccA family protein [Virgibacillus siamensis]